MRGHLCTFKGSAICSKKGAEHRNVGKENETGACCYRRFGLTQLYLLAFSPRRLCKLIARQKKLVRGDEAVRSFES